MQKTNSTGKTSELLQKSLTLLNLEEVSRFIIENHKRAGDEIEDQEAHLYSLASSFIIPVLKSEWSFGIWQDGKLIGVYLQIDILDYLKMSTIVDIDQISAIFSVVQFDHTLQSMTVNIKRGDYLLTLYNFINQQSHSLHRNQIKLIYQGFYMCKLGGWRNILFQTFNPYPFLKISAEVVEAEEKNTIDRPRSYLMKVNMNQLCFNVSPFRKIVAKL